MSTTTRDQCGAAYLFLMVLLAALGGLFAVTLQQLVPAQARHRGLAEDRLARLRGLAAEDYLRRGSFAASLATLATRTGLPTTGSWRYDPYSRTAADLRWRVTGTPRTLQLDSSGIDGTVGNGDDVTFRLSEQTLGRDRTRNRLRLLRARIVDWQATAGSFTMSSTDLATLRTAVRSYVDARRGYDAASTAQRTALTATMTASLTTIRGLRSSYGIAFPTRINGNNGLMAKIGATTGAAVDGWGRTLVWDEAVGVVSRGGDNRGGTSDDF